MVKLYMNMELVVAMLGNARPSPASLVWDHWYFVGCEITVTLSVEASMTVMKQSFPKACCRLRKTPAASISQLEMPEEPILRFRKPVCKAAKEARLRNAEFPPIAQASASDVDVASTGSNLSSPPSSRRRYPTLFLLVGTSICFIHSTIEKN